MEDFNKNWFVSRLKSAVKNAGGNNEISEVTGISISTLSKIVTGRSTPSIENTAAIARACDVTLDWLAFGVYGGREAEITNEEFNQTFWSVLDPLLDQGLVQVSPAIDRAALSKTLAKKLSAITDDLKPPFHEPRILLRKEPSQSQVTNVIPLRPEKPQYKPTQDLPLHGTAAGSLTGSISINSDVIEMLDRPEGLKDAHNAYALIVTGESMVPRYAPGDVVFINPDIEPHQDDYVIVQTQDHASAPVSSYIKRFVSRSEKSINVTQYNPPVDIEFTANNVKAVHRVMPADELYGLKL